MTTKLLLEYADFAAVLMIAGVLVAMWKRHALRDFSLLAAFLLSDILNLSIQIPLMFFRRATGISVGSAYNILFYSHIIMFGVQSLLLIGAIYSVFRLAMRPLVGLNRIGKVIFRWVAGVSVLLAFVFALGPHMLLPGLAATSEIMKIEGQLQQGINVLTLCLLLFVCFSTKPLGLTFRSHIFGVSLGLGIFATVQLVQSAWFATAQASSVYSPIFLFGTIGGCATYFVWGAYFALPEPKRGMVLLPTTSPYFLWNRISEALGEKPGSVAVAGFRPEMLHPTELMVLTAQSKSARQQRAEAQVHAYEAMESGVPVEPLKSAAGR